MPNENKDEFECLLPIGFGTYQNVPTLSTRCKSTLSTEWFGWFGIQKGAFAISCLSHQMLSNAYGPLPLSLPIPLYQSVSPSAVPQ